MIIASEKGIAKEFAILWSPKWQRNRKFLFLKKMHCDSTVLYFGCGAYIKCTGAKIINAFCPASKLALPTNVCTHTNNQGTHTEEVGICFCSTWLMDRQERKGQRMGANGATMRLRWMSSSKMIHLLLPEKGREKRVTPELLLHEHHLKCAGWLSLQTGDQATTRQSWGFFLHYFPNTATNRPTM